VLSVARELMTVGLLNKEDLERLDAEVRTEIDAAARFANESPFPSLESAFTNVWPR
jgi:TPP-dependent pyruvate/acetoin dehydrogenase alpha subunit